MSTLHITESNQKQVEKFSQQRKTFQEQYPTTDIETRRREELGPTRYGDWEVDGRCTDF